MSIFEHTLDNVNLTQSFPLKDEFNEANIIEYVDKEFKKINIPLTVICSKSCENGPIDVEWLIIPSDYYEVDVINRVKKDYNNFHSYILEYYILRLTDNKKQFVFEYGRRDSSVISIENFTQPCFMFDCHCRYELYEFISNIFKRNDIIPNRFCWD
ncbi:MAG: hypothetical protein H6609_20780 [Ignavibacteriales bacterium]|nr:hypothetical protein [Ignavibacteriales bacterium]